ncbi:MAG TPA: hypothetical protein VFV94_04990 [Polyangiaceae bacterium]|jgi:hypothetical protein|nr:hypothetical protein [Polyangiaceae bacterium]
MEGAFAEPEGGVNPQPHPLGMGWNGVPPIVTSSLHGDDHHHPVHHERGVHAYNYGNFLMVWDLVLGTFRNPQEFVAQAGFWHGASGRVGAMLIGRDVSLPVERTSPPSSAALADAE